MPRRKQVTYSSRPSLAARQAHARGDRQFRTYDTTFIQPRKSKGPTIFAIALCLVIIVAALFIFGSCSSSCSSSSSANLAASGTKVTVTIADGSSTKTIANTLQSSGLISSASDFTKRVQTLKAESSLKPGTYIITAGTGTDDIISMLEAGPTTVTVTIPEGYTVSKIASAVASASGGRITADQFTAAAHNASAYAAQYPFVASAYNNSLEGFLFPKTYEIAETDTADTMVRKMLAQYQTETSSLDWSYPSSRGLSQYDALILASIVERGSAASNRGTVASVFYNRLNEGMALQSDATVAYIVNGDPTPSDLTIDSPYNTYVYKGLPAGPICAPSIESLKAVCSPDTTNYLYFYFTQNSDGTMNYAFSETYEEHQDAIGGTLGSDGTSGA